MYRGAVTHSVMEEAAAGCEEQEEGEVRSITQMIHSVIKQIYFVFEQMLY